MRGTQCAVPEVWRGRVAMLGGVALGGVDRGAALRGQRRLLGSLWGGSVDRGAALRGQRRLGASLCGGRPRSGSRFAGTASLGVSSCDGVSPWAARRDGPIASGSRLPEGFARSGVRRASRVESTPGGTHDSAPLPSWGGYRAVRRSVRGYCARPGSRAYRVGFGTLRRGITCGFDIRGRRVRVQRRQRPRQVAAARPEALHRLERCVLGGVSC